MASSSRPMIKSFFSNWQLSSLVLLIVVLFPLRISTSKNQFKLDGVPTEYHGSQKADLPVPLLNKFDAPDVTILNSDSAIRDFIRDAGTNFPIFIGFGLNESVISNSAIKYKKKAWFSVAEGFSENMMSYYGFDKVPALVAVHPTSNDHSSFYGPFEEKFLEVYIKRSLLPLVFRINQDLLKLLKDDQRKIILTILKDEEDEKSREVIVEALKTAASANRDLVFGYVGFKQWKEFVERFGVDKKTQLPKMFVWDGDEEYYTVSRAFCFLSSFLQHGCVLYFICQNIAFSM